MLEWSKARHQALGEEPGRDGVTAHRERGHGRGDRFLAYGGVRVGLGEEVETGDGIALRGVGGMLAFGWELELGEVGEDEAAGDVGSEGGDVVGEALEPVMRGDPGGKRRLAGAGRTREEDGAFRG